MNSLEKETEQTSIQEKMSEHIYVYSTVTRIVWMVKKDGPCFGLFENGIKSKASVDIYNFIESKTGDLAVNGKERYFISEEQAAIWVLSNGKIQPERR